MIATTKRGWSVTINHVKPGLFCCMCDLPSFFLYFCSLSACASQRFGSVSEFTANVTPSANAARLKRQRRRIFGITELLLLHTNHRQSKKARKESNAITAKLKARGNAELATLRRIYYPCPCRVAKVVKIFTSSKAIEDRRRKCVNKRVHEATAATRIAHLGEFAIRKVGRKDPRRNLIASVARFSIL